MFHRWYSTDSTDTDGCMGCGVATAVIDGEHELIPLTCPGPGVVYPHHFIMVGPVGTDPAYLDCHYCTTQITETTAPAEFDWECAAR